MATKFLKHKLNGRIYSYHKHLAENPDFFEVTEEQAYPERFVPEKQKGRKSSVKLDTKEVPEEPKGSEDLDDELTRSLAKAVG